jgi:N-acetylneuraminic acid mutarotase
MRTKPSCAVDYVELHRSGARYTSISGFSKDLFLQQFAAVGSKIYAFAAWNRSDFSPSDVVEEWDVSGFDFGPSATRYDRQMPEFCWGAGVATKGTKIYVIGGYSPYTLKCLDNVQVYDTTTHQWTKGANMPTARNSLALLFVLQSAFPSRILRSAGADINRVQ